MRCRQPCRPADWAGLGNSCAIPGAEHSRGAAARWRRGGERRREGGRPSPSSSAPPDSGAFTPSFLPPCFHHLMQHTLVSDLNLEGR